MVTESQEAYLAHFPDDKTVVTYPFDPKVQISAKEIIVELTGALPGEEIYFGGSAALGIGGQNDIDIKVLTTPLHYEELTEPMVQLYGEPVRKGSSVKWEFTRNGFPVELSLANRESPFVQEHIRTDEVLLKSKSVRDEYEALKMPYGEKNFKAYMRAKYDFWNRIIGVVE